MLFDRNKEYVITDKGERWLDEGIRKKSLEEIEAELDSLSPEGAAIISATNDILIGLSEGNDLRDLIGVMLRGSPERNVPPADKEALDNMEGLLSHMIEHGLIAPVSTELPSAFEDFKMYE